MSSGRRMSKQTRQTPRARINSRRLADHEAPRWPSIRQPTRKLASSLLLLSQPKTHQNPNIPRKAPSVLFFSPHRKTAYPVRSRELHTAKMVLEATMIMYLYPQPWLSGNMANVLQYR